MPPLLSRPFNGTEQTEVQGHQYALHIGNGNMNVMYINECRPLCEQFFTEKYGTNQCMLAVRENLMKQFGVSVDT